MLVDKSQWRFSTEELIHNLSAEEQNDIRAVMEYLQRFGVCEEEAYRNRECIEKVIPYSLISNF